MNHCIHEATAFNPAYSASVIGAIVYALSLEGGSLKNRTARRFYAGESVSEYSRKEIFADLGRALIEHGIVPASQLLEEYDVSMAGIVADSISMAASRWDGLQSMMQSRSSRFLDVGWSHCVSLGSLSWISP